VGYYVLCLVKQLLSFGCWLSAVAFGIHVSLRAASGNEIRRLMHERCTARLLEGCHVPACVPVVSGPFHTLAVLAERCVLGWPAGV
jgi:uncharacterized protein YqfA (UPF0365 family)